MSSIEGMWAFVCGSFAAPNDVIDRGILVLESGRVFGGDSAMAYQGSFAVKGEHFTAHVLSWTWNSTFAASGIPNAFGVTGQDRQRVLFEANRTGNRIDGHMYLRTNPGAKLSAALVKITDLP